MNGGAHKGNGRKWLRRALPVAAVVACPLAWAQLQSTAAETMALPGLSEQTARLEVGAAPMVRADGFDSGRSAQRIDFTLLPPRKSAVGLAVGMSGLPTASPGAPATAFAPAATPAFDVGLHWRHTLDSNHRFDFTAYRRMAQPGDVPLLAQDRPPQYGARLEFNLSPQRAGKRDFDSEKGFIGMQLENGGRISIRRKHGGPMVYYRVRF